MREFALRLAARSWPRAVLARHSARRGVGVIAGLTLVAKGLGFVRELTVAALFGASGLVDAYRIAEVLTSLGASLGRQGFDVAAIPLLVERRVRAGDSGQRRLLGSFRALGLVGAAAVSLLLFLIAFLLPRFVGSAGQLAFRLVVLMVPAVGAVILASVAGAWYNSRRQFALPRLFDPVVNLVAVAALLLLARNLSVYALAAGWSIGHLAALAVVLVPLLLAGHHGRGRLADPGVREFVRLALPALPLALIQPLNIAVGRVFAAALPSGSIALLGYADRLFAFPAGLVAASLTPVFFTRAAELAAAGHTAELNRRTAGLLGRLALILIPTGLLLVPLARPLVRLLYERGAFTAAATETTARAFALYGLGLFPAVAAALLAAALRSRKQAAAPLVAVLVGTAVNCGLAALLVRRLGVPGLALASSIGITVTAAGLWLMLRRRAPDRPVAEKSRAKSQESKAKAEPQPPTRNPQRAR